MDNLYLVHAQLVIMSYIPLVIYKCLVLKAVARLCDLAAPPQFHLHWLPLCVAQAGGLNTEVKGKKISKNCAIIVRSACMIGDFSQFLPTTGRTTACKQGIMLLFP